MLISASKLIGMPILSIQVGGVIGLIKRPIINPDNLTIIAFEIDNPPASANNKNFLDVSSIREYSTQGLIIDSVEELVASDEVVKISDILALNFDVINLKVETKKRSKLGKVIDYTVTDDNFSLQQIIVKRPIVKSLLDPELVIPRKEIVEVDDYKIVVKDEEKIIKEKSLKENFVPNFVNPFRDSQQGFAPADSQNLVDKDN